MRERRKGNKRKKGIAQRMKWARNDIMGKIFKLQTY
jgi:hypothetical protein